jgi:membrane protein
MVGGGFFGRLAAGLRAARSRWGWFDHLVRAGGRYRAESGDRLAASVTYYAFLSFFPLLLLGLSVIGFVLEGSPTLQAEVLASLRDYLPGVYREITANLISLIEHRRTAGVLGLLGLVWAGLGWLDALRQALRVMWHHDVDAGNIVRRKALDVVTLLGLGVAIAASLVFTGVLGTSASWLLREAGAGKTSVVAVLVTGALGLAAGTLADTGIFLYLFKRLPRLDEPLSRLVRGAVFAAVGFGVMKVIGRLYVTRYITTGSRVFGTFAVVAGLVVWLNLIAKFTLYAAAWTVTAPYDDDRAPSGTSSPDAERRAGLSPAQAAALRE